MAKLMRYFNVLAIVLGIVLFALSFTATQKAAASCQSDRFFQSH
jgi:hypothetical protein